MSLIDFHRGDICRLDVVGGHAVATAQHIHSLDIEAIDLFPIVRDTSALFDGDARHFLEHVADGPVGAVEVLCHGIDKCVASLPHRRFLDAGFGDGERCGFNQQSEFLRTGGQASLQGLDVECIAAEQQGVGCATVS